MDVLELKLCNPLFYQKSQTKNNLEELFCFELNPLPAQSFDPQADQLIGKQVFHGFAAPPDARRMEAEGMELPVGPYLFAQTRENTAPDYWLFMAIEAQKDGLWKRIRLENRLFVRILFEDGEKVTQVFRPCSLSSDLRLNKQGSQERL
jgi:hypothetical protein